MGLGGFLDSGPEAPQQDVQLLRQLGCKVCPLDKIKGNKHPHMEPTGAARPLVYVLGEAPGKEEDRKGIQFVGPSGELLRARIPKKFDPLVRWNNCVRTRPLYNKTPEKVEIECCRPSIVADIEQSQPKAILGFGNIPLQWLTGFNGITAWNGRRVPVKVGGHTCWYYPLVHPSYLLRKRRASARQPTDVGSEDERMFALQLRQIFAEVKGLPKAVVHTAGDARRGLEPFATGAAAVDQVEAFLEAAHKQPEIGLDYETHSPDNSPRPYGEGTRLLSVALSWGSRSLAFPLDHPNSGLTEEQEERIWQLWKAFLYEYRGVKIVHNLAFELEWSGFFFGSKVIRAGRWDDSCSQACVIDERRGKYKPGPFSLEFLVQQYFGFNLKKLSGLDRTRLINVPLDSLLTYNALDAKYHLLLWQKQKQVIEDAKLKEPYRLALRRVPTVILSQLKGVPVDQKEVNRLQGKYADRMEALETEIKALPIVRQFKKKAGHSFNPFSNPDVIYVFDKMLKRKEVHVTDKYTGDEKLSADKTILAQMTDEPLAGLLNNLRESHRRKATYLDPIAVGGKQLHPDGQLHAQFNTVFAETGRLSCQDPNLQNWPKRQDEAKELRKCIRAEPGYTILAFDYGQIEARVIAMFTKDKRFCKALWERYDVHMEWAERLAYAYPSRVGGRKVLKDFEAKTKSGLKAMKDFRTDVKNQWTFPLFFGAKMESAAGYLSMPEDIIGPLYDEFWEQFSGVKDWQDDLLKFYARYGYVECLTKRRRHGPLSLNAVINSPVQGTAAEIVMDAMSRLSELNDPELQPEINIHDDLTYVRVPKDRVDQIFEKVVDVMLDVPFSWVNVPITVEASIGPDWLNMEEVGDFSSDTWKR